MKFLRWSSILALFTVLIINDISAKTMKYAELPKTVWIENFPVFGSGDSLRVWLYAPSEKKIYTCSGRAKRALKSYICFATNPKSIKRTLISRHRIDPERKFGQLQTQTFSIIDLPEMSPPFQQFLTHLVFVHKGTGEVQLCRKVVTKYEFETVIRNHTVYFHSKREPVIKYSCERKWPTK